MKKSVVIIMILNILAALALPMVCSVESKENYTRNSDFLRLHVRANSDGKEDQELKLKVRDSVLLLTTSLLKNCENKEDAIAIISENLDEIEKTAEKTLFENGKGYPVYAEIKKEHFEYREYDGFFLPEDVYDSLIINIGRGEGKNWWCVVFPAVCLSGSSSPDTAEISDGKTEDKNSSEKEGGDDGKESGSASVKVDVSAVSEEYRLSDSTVPENVRYDFWIVRFFKSIFGIE